MKERLQKIIARAGVTSRRGAEELISAGKVKVNGKVVTELGTKAEEGRDTIEVSGRKIGRSEPIVYYALYKPTRVVTTMDDPEGRPSVGEYVEKIPQRVFPVGRLDFDSEGLLLMTNDGDLAARLMHPKHKIPKTYQVKIKGRLTPSDFQSISAGKFRGGGRVGAATLKPLSKLPGKEWLEIILTEGKNRQVRKIFEEAGYDVIKLKRVAIGGLTLGDMRPGQIRKLAPDEVLALKSL